MLKAVVGHATGIDEAAVATHGSKMKKKSKGKGKGKAAKKKPHRPFFWGGRNVSPHEIDRFHSPRSESTPPRPTLPRPHQVLLDLIRAKDFVANFKELCDYYGRDFNVYGNPFSVAVPIAQRPATPVPAFQTVIIDGEQVKVPSKAMAAEFERAESQVQESLRRQRESAEWWPCHGISDGELARVRRAEKVLLVECELGWS